MILVYLFGMAVLLAIVIMMRSERVREDGWEPVPWYVCLAVFVLAISWPIWVLVALVAPRQRATD